jgi:hypothetical protein
MAFPSLIRLKPVIHLEILHCLNLLTILASSGLRDQIIAGPCWSSHVIKVLSGKLKVPKTTRDVRLRDFLNFAKC